MTERRKTLRFGCVALALLLITWVTAPRVRTPSVLASRGNAIFPQFRDANAAASLETVEFDTASGRLRAFKVQNRDGRWTIPSQYDYPVDGKDQLASIAAAVIALRIDDFASDNVSDHERSGVLDPLDPATTSVSGRGTRVTIRGAHDEIIADVIIGHPVEGHPGLRYIRQPDQRRVYICNVGELKISTALADWIERDLLQVDTEEIDAVNIRYYSIDRGTGSINPGETMLLQKKQEGGWTINGLGANEKLEFQAIDALVKNLANLTITGVLPKPPGITAALSHEANQARVAPGEKADLARKGFYLATNGQLVSDRGEVVVRTTRGVFYTLRFGDIAPGTDAPAVDATSDESRSARSTTRRENRYLFITLDFDPTSARTPGRASEGATKAQLLRARFAPWYYVIGTASFSAIHPPRSVLVK